MRYAICILWVMFISIIFNNESSYKLPTEILAGWRLTIKCQTLPPSDRDIIRARPGTGLPWEPETMTLQCWIALAWWLMATAAQVCICCRSLGAGWRREGKEGPGHPGESLHWHWPHPVPGFPLKPGGAVRLILTPWHLTKTNLEK